MPADSPWRLAAVCAAGVLAASAIAHATGGRGTAVVAPVVVVVGDRPGAIATGFTTGDGRVVTVAHVLDGPTVAVRGADGVARRATVLRRDAATDLAVLAAPGVEAGPEQSGGAAAGGGAGSAGAAAGGAASSGAAAGGAASGGAAGGGAAGGGGVGGEHGVLVRRGAAVSALRAAVVRHVDATVRAGDGRVLARRPVLELRAPIRAGDSGAPVVDARGVVVGVVFARSRTRDGVAYAVDASALARLGASTSHTSALAPAMRR